jgi:hypothetical protein
VNHMNRQTDELGARVVSDLCAGTAPRIWHCGSRAGTEEVAKSAAASGQPWLHRRRGQSLECVDGVIECRARDRK